MRRTIRKLLVVGLLTLALVAILPAGAMADFGIRPDLDITFTEPDGSPSMQAGSHPFQMTTTLNFNRTTDPEYGEVPDEAVKDVTIQLPPGQVADARSMPQCSTLAFVSKSCPEKTAVGEITVEINTVGEFVTVPVFNLTPPPGQVLKLGFLPLGLPVTLNVRLNDEPPYNGVVTLSNISNVYPIYSSKTTIRGTPAEAEGPFLTLPRSCPGPLKSVFETDSWQNPGTWLRYEVETHDNAIPPQPLGTTGCGKLGFKPSIEAVPTTKAAQSPSGLDFNLNVNDEGLTNPAGLAQSDIEKTVVTLPEGFSTNPSLAEGLEVCSEADLARETPFSDPGEGCPEAAKIGTVEVESQLVDEKINGSLYIAKPYENPFGSLIALYIVIKNPNLGIKVVQPLEVIPDPVTGRLTTVAEDMPQLPFSHFRLHFREGTRSPLASPPGCGTYEAKAVLSPYSGTAPVTTTSAFQIITGPNEGPCPTGGLPPFKPGLIAGTLNNAAGRFSPFNLRLSRTDSEQEFTHFSIKLPPGIVGILAGIPYCPDQAIEAAKQRTGTEELASPSCPAASEIGRTLAGGGVGPSLAYAPGKIYLAGPYKGTSFSLAAITAVKVGPFDLGTVVVRQGFKVDRETAEVFIDATESDPIPHIIDGIPVHLRDIRAYVDKSKFVFNPTSCERTSTASTLLGSGLDFGSAADDRPVTVSTPFQAADCAALKFEPKLKLQLKGGTRRGAHPAFRAELKMNGGPERGEANIARAQVTLPKSAFLENAHIKTICTRVQFRANQCPAGSVYGFARAYTPVLAEPLQGPVYLRSSEHQLPDLVASLHHEKITVDVVGRVDSLKGRIRNTFEAVPDAPVTKFVLTMQGGKKGLIVNSTNLCKGTHKAIADFSAQNGKVKEFNPAVTAKCGGKGKSKRRHRAG
jgi:hypothetical protein